MRRKSKSVGGFQKISGIKKVIRCIVCGKRISISNFNQTKCIECGYRGINSDAIHE